MEKDNLTQNNKEIVKLFLETVRSGRVLENVSYYLSDVVVAHQMNSENQSEVKRTPQDYKEHVQEFLEMFGKFSFEITALIAEEDKVYARWIQKGKHLAVIEGFKPTGAELTEIASAVYRLENSKIVEYWIQIDRLGFEKQLQRNS
ncbi:putative ester cyclase [Pedobacter sp. UYP30]|uniref:ester cyclase n=1 Tax=Pedobacter sp. UYP30 TaxID=1756400 RepID=UPI00339A68AD